MTPIKTLIGWSNEPNLFFSSWMNLFSWILWYTLSGFLLSCGHTFSSFFAVSPSCDWALLFKRNTDIPQYLAWFPLFFFLLLLKVICALKCYVLTQSMIPPASDPTVNCLSSWFTNSKSRRLSSLYAHCPRYGPVRGFPVSVNDNTIHLVTQSRNLSIITFHSPALP